MSGGARVFRTKLKQPGIIVVAGCYSALTARITEAEGFDALWCGGSSMAAVHLGLPDHALITSTEMATLIAPIANSVSIPLIADADLGGETSANVMRTVHVYERAGVAAILLDDTQGGCARSIDEMCSRIAAAAKARSDPDFVIIVRTDHGDDGAHVSVDEMIRRGRAYAEAGADVFCPHSTTLTEVDRVADAVPIPLQSTHLRHSAVRATKLKVLNHGSGFLVQEAAFLHRQMLRHLKKDGEWGDVPDWYDEARTVGATGTRPEAQKAGLRRHLSGEEFRALRRDSDYQQIATEWARLKDQATTRG